MVLALSRLIRQVRRRRELGLGVLLLILVGSIAGNALTLPREAIVHDRGRPFVWVLGQDQTAEKRPVELGIQNAARTEISGGLDGSEQVLLQGAVSLEAGSRVIPVAQAR